MFENEVNILCEDLGHLGCLQKGKEGLREYGPMS
jgi:hypothetical protein